jgi:hypothetical protein
MMNFSLNTEYFSSTQNYNRYGDSVPLFITNGNYTNITTTLDASFDLEGNFVIGGGVDLGVASTKTATPPITIEDVTFNNSQITNAHFFGQYFFDYDRFRIVPEVKGSLTFQTINLSDIFNTSPLTQEYTNTAQAGAWAIVNFGSLRGWGYLGFKYQDDNRANLMPWEAGLLWRNHNLLLAGSFDGYQTVVNDTYSNTNPYIRETRIDYADGGSFRYYSTNPSVTEVKVIGGYAFENNIIVTVGYGATISGTETALGSTVYGGISFGVDMAGGPASSFSTHKKRKPVMRDNGDGTQTPMPRPMDASPDQNGGFQPDLEQYDESLFD